MNVYSGPPPTEDININITGLDAALESNVTVRMLEMAFEQLQDADQVVIMFDKVNDCYKVRYRDQTLHARGVENLVKCLGEFLIKEGA